MLGKSHFRSWPPRMVLAVLFVPLFVGCGSKGTVSGKVFYQGKPLPGGTVTFLEDTGAFHSVIHEDGSYRIAGVPPGNATITVSTPDPPKQASSSPMAKAMKNAKGWKGEIPPEEMAKHMGDPEAGKRRYMAIPSKYKDPKQSGLTYTVKSGSQNFDIQLK